MIDLAKVGNKIAHFREEKGYSQEALANKLFVSRQAVSAWEVGKSAPSIDNVIELSKLFEVPFEDILCLGEKPSYDANDPFGGHERGYVIREVIKGEIKPNWSKFLYKCTGEERLLLVKAIANKQIKTDTRELENNLTDEEKRILLGENKR